jgi:hypothetical protein
LNAPAATTSPFTHALPQADWRRQHALIQTRLPIIAAYNEARANGITERARCSTISGDCAIYNVYLASDGSGFYDWHPVARVPSGGEFLMESTGRYLPVRNAGPVLLFAAAWPSAPGGAIFGFVPDAQYTRLGSIS